MTETEGCAGFACKTGNGGFKKGNGEVRKFKMENNKSEFLGMVCNFYIIALLAVIPLYTERTYYLIGDTKYIIFRNISFLCLGLWIVVTAVFSLWECLLQPHRGKRLKTSVKKWIKSPMGGKTVDIFMFFYGACVLLSAILSPYRETAWLGYQDWHMGAISQLMFVGIYFFVSRYYTGSALPLYLGEAALFLVTILGFVNRLGWDPLGVFQYYHDNDWGYSHMLSTIGNINWLCGYFSVAIAFPVAGYLNSDRRVKTGVLYGISVLGLGLLVLQGSDSGVAIAALCLGLCILLGYFPSYRHRRKELWCRGLLLLTAVILLIPIMGYLIELRGSQATMPIDSLLDGRLKWIGWWFGAGIALTLYCLLRVLPKRAGRILVTAFFVLAGLAVGGRIFLYFLNQPSGSGWGSSRGGLWNAAWKGFQSAGLLQKFTGAGPDCYAEYIYRLMAAEEVTQITGYWEGAVFANAHNEWLNQLVNLGLLGTAVYLGIFVSALKRYRGMLLGLFALVLYGANSLISFQQVLNAPLLFLVLGLCENRLRKR